METMLYISRGEIVKRCIFLLGSYVSPNFLLFTQLISSITFNDNS